MAGQKTISTTYVSAPPPVIPPAVADCHVTGVMIPDIKYDYFIAGTSSGKPYFKTAGDEFFIFWNPVHDAWWISDNIDLEAGGYFWRENLNVLGLYSAGGGWTGTATVVAGPA